MINKNLTPNPSPKERGAAPLKQGMAVPSPSPSERDLGRGRLSRSTIWFTIFGLLLLIFFLLDIMLGSVKIPMDTVLYVLSGAESKPSWQYIVLNFRLPKAITAILAGAGMAVTGLQMQTLFKNPLADTSILGIGNGASLGVALFVLASALMPTLFLQGSSFGNMGIVIAAVIGASEIGRAHV